MYHKRKHQSKSSYCTEYLPKRDPNKPKILKKNYHITTQTATHIAELAIQENTSEGRILDKIVRTYMEWRKTSI